MIARNFSSCRRKDTKHIAASSSQKSAFPVMRPLLHDMQALILGLAIGTLLRTLKLDLYFFGHKPPPTSLNFVHHSSENTPITNSTESTIPPTSDLRITCVIEAASGDEESLEASLNTWVAHCDHFVLISNESSGSRSANFTYKTDWTGWIKLRETLRYLYQERKNLSKVFLMTRAKTYVDVPALKKYLKIMKFPDRPFVVSNMKVQNGFPYVSPTPAQVINFPVVERVANRLDDNEDSCKWLSWESTWITFTKCLTDVGVEFIDARDANRGLLFLPALLTDLHSPKHTSILNKLSLKHLQSVGPVNSGCSEFPLAMNVNGADDIYTIDFLTQRLQVATKILPPKNITFVPKKIVTRSTRTRRVSRPVKRSQKAKIKS